MQRRVVACVDVELRVCSAHALPPRPSMEADSNDTISTFLIRQFDRHTRPRRKIETWGRTTYKQNPHMHRNVVGGAAVLSAKRGLGVGHPAIDVDVELANVGKARQQSAGLYFYSLNEYRHLRVQEHLLTEDTCSGMLWTRQGCIGVTCRIRLRCIRSEGNR